ncbi:MAG: undecaprenyldiphospho-muramoylpentapeptide beta-N-acetylglucosaminyltransferase [Chloroflexi bacterium]|nr:undecaprenyldiphospho-muramoylpentapeptide beta-N-acetylglucosaminyltransferase [Chloroflexota bacterium]
MRIAITGGGTGGHVSPAMALVEELRRMSGQAGDPVTLLYIGSAGGIEERMAGQEGIPFASVQAGKLRRYPSLKTLTDALRIPVGVLQAARHVARFHPDVLLSTGGYVSIPAVVAAGLQRVPVIVHEQTVTTGLANKISTPFATVIAVSFESSRSHFPGKRVELTGNPVRRVVTSGNREEGMEFFGFSPGMPVVYVTGGVQGARAINRAVGECLEELLTLCQVIHQCGPGDGSGGDGSWLLDKASQLPDPLRQRYQLLEFAGAELAHIYAIADLVVGRAGAGTMAELCVTGKPSLLVPLPQSANDEQRQNALMLMEAGASVMLEQEQLTPDSLATAIQVLVSDRPRLSAMSAAALALGKPDAARALAQLVLSVGRRHGVFH